MVNTEDFIKRLEILLEYYGLSASLFADKVGVQRSGLSHLMSGRNKPSLDFVMKIVENFPEVDLYWLLADVGEFPKSDNPQHSIPQPAPAPTSEKVNEMPDLFSETKNDKITQPTIANQPSQLFDNKEIERIVVFYKNGSFKNYMPEN
ncbi:helix-turn-helix transcriptional regulator [Flavobacterium zepuense]|uniref:Helix-turn-helix transcriptional regulator n=1 Tax=Flavobacterium zepuense TaxID=2593302 RepID=A0A552V5K7_9FLAO|nr:helix-turn-helix transcriptional regulator [Flavobacterium zepuense]TRW25737.1 helix-turn-helix transcriptional regulator [Flavobacterium zepuense]